MPFEQGHEGGRESAGRAVLRERDSFVRAEVAVEDLGPKAWLKEAAGVSCQLEAQRSGRTEVSRVGLWISSLPLGAPWRGW